MNGFRDALIRRIFKIEEKQIKVLKNVSSRKYLLDYDGADGNDSEELKEEIDENDDNPESRQLVLSDGNNKPNGLTLDVKKILNSNGDDKKRNQLSMETDSSSKNHKSRSKKKQF